MKRKGCQWVLGLVVVVVVLWCLGLCCSSSGRDSVRSVGRMLKACV